MILLPWVQQVIRAFVTSGLWFSSKTDFTPVGEPPMGDAAGRGGGGDGERAGVVTGEEVRGGEVVVGVVVLPVAGVGAGLVVGAGVEVTGAGVRLANVLDSSSESHPPVSRIAWQAAVSYRIIEVMAIHQLSHILLQAAYSMAGKCVTVHWPDHQPV
jgi:hypothetical protein